MQTFDVVNPGTGSVVGTQPIHDADDIGARLEQARAAQPYWAALGFDGREQAMTRWVRWLAERCEEIYAMGHAETARPIGDVQMEFVAGIEEIRWAAANAQRILKPRRVAPGI